jgi:hypothetical protein
MSADGLHWIWFSNDILRSIDRPFEQERQTAVDAMDILSLDNHLFIIVFHLRLSTQLDAVRSTREPEEGEVKPRPISYGCGTDRMHVRLVVSA